jgi:putative DNA primase/helicase
MQAWALRQRAQGRTVLFIHHAGKGGAQRGTSRREDVLDTVIALRRPAEYTPEQGATFEVHFEKSRGIYGEDVRPFEASLTTSPDGRMSWTTRSLEDSTLERVVALLNDGLSQKEVAIELGINKSNVCRHAKTAKELGLLKGGEK